jgi:hypothetical protein
MYDCFTLHQKEIRFKGDNKSDLRDISYILADSIFDTNEARSF